MSAARTLLSLTLSSHVEERGCVIGEGEAPPHPHGFAAFSWVTAISGRQPW